MDLGYVFITGLVAGGITCAVVQGGLLLSLLATRKQGEESSLTRADTVKVIAQFLSGKLVVYAVIGGVLGWVGSRLVINAQIFGWAQIIAGIYMLGVVGAILEIHPLFRVFLWQAPRWAGKEVRSQSKSLSGWAPFWLGLATGLIPCGVTQAMMAQAITSGSLVKGVLTLGVFTIGTMPLFVLLGLGFVTAGRVIKGGFVRIAAVLVAVIALVSLNAGLILTGSPVYPSGVLSQIYCTISFCPKQMEPPSNALTIEIDGSGYRLDHSVVKAGSVVNLTIMNKNATGCQQAFTIPSLGISKIVPVGGLEQLTFTAPTKPGVLAYSCSMGMYAGELTVVD